MKHLTKEQKCQIKACLNCNKSKLFIAESLQVDKGSIYRELEQKSTKIGLYNPNFAQELATERKERFGRNRSTPTIKSMLKSK